MTIIHAVNAELATLDTDILISLPIATHFQF
jgi:hypothetical protein